jgi:uncharacterized lipoprotein
MVQTLGDIMKASVKTLLLAALLITGVAGCAPLTAQQKEAIDYQNHKPYAI